MAAVMLPYVLQVSYPADSLFFFSRRKWRDKYRMFVTADANIWKVAIQTPSYHKQEMAGRKMGLPEEPDLLLIKVSLE